MLARAPLTPTYLVETHQWFSNGYQPVDRGGESGLDVRDYTLKMAYERGAHAVEMKLQHAAQTSNQSYLGLTDVDFRAEPDRRYGLSALDQIDTEHEQAIFRYTLAPRDGLELGAVAYENRHARNWFKTEGFDADGSADAASFSRTSWAAAARTAPRR